MPKIRGIKGPLRNDIALGAEMEKDGDAGDAVCASFFPAVLIFWIFTGEIFSWLWDMVGMVKAEGIKYSRLKADINIISSSGCDISESESLTNVTEVNKSLAKLVFWHVR